MRSFWLVIFFLSVVTGWAHNDPIDDNDEPTDEWLSEQAEQGVSIISSSERPGPRFIRTIRTPSNTSATINQSIVTINQSVPINQSVVTINQSMATNITGGIVFNQPFADDSQFTASNQSTSLPKVVVTLVVVCAIQGAVILAIMAFFIYRRLRLRDVKPTVVEMQTPESLCSSQIVSPLS